jgi:hypothetical protein
MEARHDEETKRVYTVSYIHTFQGGGQNYFHIGIYSTKAAAEGAVAQLVEQPGFRDDLKGFTIDEVALDDTSWQDGFITEYDR